MRLGELLANLLLLGSPLFILGLLWWILVIAQSPKTFNYISIALFGIGFILFLKAKWSLMSKGKLMSFGPHQMTNVNPFFYRAGYLLMGFGLFITLALILMYISLARPVIVNGRMVAQHNPWLVSSVTRLII